MINYRRKLNSECHTLKIRYDKCVYRGEMGIFSPLKNKTVYFYVKRKSQAIKPGKSKIKGFESFPIKTFDITNINLRRKKWIF